MTGAASGSSQPAKTDRARLVWTGLSRARDAGGVEGFAYHPETTLRFLATQENQEPQEIEPQGWPRPLAPTAARRRMLVALLVAIDNSALSPHLKNGTLASHVRSVGTGLFLPPLTLGEVAQRGPKEDDDNNALDRLGALWEAIVGLGDAVEVGTNVMQLSFEARSRRRGPRSDARRLVEKLIQDDDFRRAYVAEQLPTGAAIDWVRSARQRAVAVKKIKTTEEELRQLVEPQVIRAYALGELEAPLHYFRHEWVREIASDPRRHRMAAIVRSWEFLVTVGICWKHHGELGDAVRGGDINDWTDGQVFAEAAYADRFETADVGQHEKAVRIKAALALAQNIEFVASE